MNDIPPSSDVETPEPAPARGRSRDFWLVYLLFIVFCIGAILGLPPQAASIVLPAAVILSLVIVARDAAVSRNDIRTGGVNLLKLLRGQTNIASHNAGMLMMIAATGLMFVAANLMRPHNNNELVNQGVSVLLIGGVLVGLSLWFSRYNIPDLTLTSVPLTPANSRWGLTALGTGLMLILAEISGNLLKLNLATIIPHRLEFIMLVVGCGLLVWGLSGAATFPNPFDLNRLRSINWRYHAPLLAIFALALFLRVIDLNNTIRGSVDEVLVINSFNQVYTIKDAGIATQVSHFHTT
ncbi:MAG TPA: hypothetical protein VHL11_19155, partial [Phototrophicaceae bacterium]|nr:hypothetical protein [Phototrophicaceae bacterium]